MRFIPAFPILLCLLETCPVSVAGKRFTFQLTRKQICEYLKMVMLVTDITHQCFESSYLRVVGMETRAESMFLNDPPLTLYSIYIKIVHYFRDGRPNKAYYSKVICCLQLIYIYNHAFQSCLLLFGCWENVAFCLKEFSACESKRQQQYPATKVLWSVITRECILNENQI